MVLAAVAAPLAPHDEGEDAAEQAHHEHEDNDEDDVPVRLDPLAHGGDMVDEVVHIDARVRVGHVAEVGVLVVDGKGVVGRHLVCIYIYMYLVVVC